MSKVCKLDDTFTSLCPKGKMEKLLSDPTIVNLTAKFIVKCNVSKF